MLMTKPIVGKMKVVVVKIKKPKQKSLFENIHVHAHGYRQSQKNNPKHISFLLRLQRSALLLQLRMDSIVISDVDRASSHLGGVTGRNKGPVVSHCF